MGEQTSSRGGTRRPCPIGLGFASWKALSTRRTTRSASARGRDAMGRHGRGAGVVCRRLEMRRRGARRFTRADRLRSTADGHHMTVRRGRRRSRACMKSRWICGINPGDVTTSRARTSTGLGDIAETKRSRRLGQHAHPVRSARQNADGHLLVGRALLRWRRVCSRCAIRHSSNINLGNPGPNVIRLHSDVAKEKKVRVAWNN